MPDRPLKNFIFFIVTIIGISLIAEIGFRIYYKIKKEPFSSEYIYNDIRNHTVNNALLGWTLKPNYNGYMLSPKTDYKEYTVDEKGGKVIITTNSLGLKTRELYPESTKGVTRIFCLGDSITEEPNISNKDTYPNILENLLNNGNQSKKFEVFNCGLRGYDTHQEYLLLKHKLLEYKPDIVIIGYYINDGLTFLPVKNIFLLLSEIKFLQKSAFYHAFEKLVMKYIIKFEYKKWSKNQFMWVDLYSRKSWGSDRRTVDKLIKMAWRDWGIAWTPKGKQEVFTYLSNILDLRQTNNFKLVIACFPVSMQVYGIGGQELNLYEPQDDMKRFCDANSVPFIDLIPYLRRYNNEDIFQDHCHYKSRGLKAVAEAISDELKKQKVIP